MVSSHGVLGEGHFESVPPLFICEGFSARALGTPPIPTAGKLWGPMPPPLIIFPDRGPGYPPPSFVPEDQKRRTFCLCGHKRESASVVFVDGHFVLMNACTPGCIAHMGENMGMFSVRKVPTFYLVTKELPCNKSLSDSTTLFYMQQV